MNIKLNSHNQIKLWRVVCTLFTKRFTTDKKEKKRPERGLCDRVVEDTATELVPAKEREQTDTGPRLQREREREQRSDQPVERQSVIERFCPGYI